MQTIKQYLSEKKVDPKLESIAKIIKGKALMDLSKPLESIFKKKDINFVLSPIAHYRIKDGSKTLIIVNKRYADKAEIVQDDLAIGYEGRV